jgi:glycosyltransferase involved in cell wall biosynthesis
MTRKEPYIMMVVPNLPEQGGGGVVQVIGYLRDAWLRLEGVPEMRLLVTRGRGSIWLSPLFLLRALMIIAVECGCGRVALVHVNVASRGSTWRKITIVAAARLFGVPVVLHLHGGGYRLFVAALPEGAKRLVGWMFRRADHVMVLGQGWREFTRQAFQLADNNITVLPNGVPDPGPAKADGKDEMARLLFMGRFSPEKGVTDLIEALGDGGLAALEWTAVIAGAGDMSARDHHRLHGDLSGRAAVPGWLSNEQARQAFSSANIFVLPSHLEGLSLSLLEAMAHGLAVVATPVGAHGEVIQDGQNGLLVPPGDAPALTIALRRLIIDRSLRQSLGQAARRRFVAKYHIARTVEQLRSVYDHVMT